MIQILQLNEYCCKDRFRRQLHFCLDAVILLVSWYITAFNLLIIHCFCIFTVSYYFSIFEILQVTIIHACVRTIYNRAHTTNHRFSCTRIGQYMDDINPCFEMRLLQNSIPSILNLNIAIWYIYSAEIWAIQIPTL